MCENSYFYGPLHHENVDNPAVFCLYWWGLGVEQKSSFAPGVEQKSSFAPGVEQKSSFAPGVEQKSSFAPGVEQKSSFAPGGTEARNGLFMRRLGLSSFQCLKKNVLLLLLFLFLLQIYSEVSTPRYNA